MTSERAQVLLLDQPKSSLYTEHLEKELKDFLEMLFPTQAALWFFSLEFQGAPQKSDINRNYEESKAGIGVMDERKLLWTKGGLTRKMLGPIPIS